MVALPETTLHSASELAIIRLVPESCVTPAVLDRVGLGGFVQHRDRRITAWLLTVGLLKQ